MMYLYHPLKLNPAFATKEGPRFITDEKLADMVWKTILAEECIRVWWCFRDVRAETARSRIRTAIKELRVLRPAIEEYRRSIELR